MYESWRLPWQRYGALVQAVALALEGGVSAANDAIVAAATAAFHGEGEHFDPVEALVAPLMIHRSRGERRVAASVLVAHDIGEDRARIITGARGQLPQWSIEETVPPAISFDQLVGAVGPRRSVQSDARAATRWRWAGATVGIAIAVTVGGGGGWMAKHRGRSASAPYLLWPEQLPTPWVLVSAQATGPSPMRTQSPLVQTFSSGYSISAQITVGDEVDQFVEPDLGSINDQSVHMVDEAWFAAAHAQVNDVGNGRVQAHWREQGSDVAMESRGLSVDKVQSFITGLVPRTDFLRAGFEYPAWAESHTGGVGAAPADVQGVTMLGFRSSENPQKFVTVRAVPVLPSKRSEQVPSASGEPFALRKGVVARVRNRPTSGIAWIEPKAGLVVNMISNDRAADISMKELAQSLSVGSAKQWLRAVAPFRQSLAGGTLTDTFALGPLAVSIHATQMANGVVCVLNICTMTDNRSPEVQSADLLVAGRWWHFDHTLSTYRAPTWRTAPATALVASYEVVRNNYTWRALDLGTTGRALRRGDDDFAFTRPLG